MINRLLEGRILERLNQGKAIIVLGARQTGKTTLLRKLFGGQDQALFLNADQPDVVALFEHANSSRLKAAFQNYQLVVVDEAQRIKDVGLKFKLITDELPGIQLIASGSSAFELANEMNEPLTGRKFEYRLFPLSFGEMCDHHGFMEENRLLPHRLVYGYYPEVVTATGHVRELLQLISESYLYKDIFRWERLKKPDKLVKLLQALAWQVGSEVSYNELGNIVGLDHATVEKYIQLLEQCFVVFRLGAFKRNLRKELSRGRKIYFYDNGIRNALIASFSPFEIRNDKGELWENFLISERIKWAHYQQQWQNIFFWRTQDKQEIDFIEERDGLLYAYEFKLSIKRKARLSKTFAKAYPNHTFQIVHPDNYEEFLLQKK